MSMVKKIHLKSFVVGLYCGKKKPVEFEDFHEDFLSNVEQLLPCGFINENIIVKYAIDCVM